MLLSYRKKNQFYRFFLLSLSFIILSFIVRVWFFVQLPIDPRLGDYYSAVRIEDVSAIPSFDASAVAGEQMQTRAVAQEPILKANKAIAQELVLRAFIKGVIMFAEGTYPNSKGLNPYKIIVGYQTFEDFSDHPRISVPIPGIGSSDAAGGIQYMSFTWDGLHIEYKPDSGIWYSNQPAFSPKNQEVGAVLLLKRRGSLRPVLESFTVDDTGKIIPNVEKFTLAVNKSCQEWASFPCADGKGAYGQSFKSIETLWQNFQKALEEEQTGFVPVVANNAPPPEQQTIAPTPETSGTNPEDFFPDDMKLPAKDGEMIPGKDGASYPIPDVRRFRTHNPVTKEAGYNRWHDGYDLGIGVGVALYAPMPGKAVCHIGYNSGFGTTLNFSLWG